MADGDRHGDDDWVLPSAAIADVTLTLVGKIGSGKSATANSILGKKAFPSEFSYSGVTEICEMRSTTFHDGCMARNLHVIDTPGLFDIDNTAENVRNEIINCTEMAKDGIHAMLMVFSAASRFSCEDEKTIESIKLFYGDKILNHIVLVFTHGDVVGEETTRKKKLTDSAPGYLQGMLNLCKNRVVLFNNKTSNKTQSETQLKKLLDAVDFVILRNGGKTFSNQTAHIQEGRRQENINVDGYSAEQISRLKEEIYDECLAQMATMVEDPNKTIKRLEKHLLEEQKARQDLKNKTMEEMAKLKEEIQRLWEILENAKKESDRGKDETKKLDNRLKTVENYKIIKNAKKESDNAKKLEKSKKQETKK